MIYFYKSIAIFHGKSKTKRELWQQPDPPVSSNMGQDIPALNGYDKFGKSLNYPLVI